MEPKLSIAPGALRHAAEMRLKAKPASHPAQTETDLRRLQHELEVHQIELEMQNDELRRAQDQAAEDLERYTELYDFAPVGYVSLSADGTIVRLNLLGATLMGLERGRLVGRGFGQFVTEADRHVFREFLARVLAGDDKQSCELRLPHGTTGPRVLHLEGLRSPDGQECRAVLLDITARKQAETALRQSEEDFRSMAESMPQIVWVTRPDGWNIYFNQQWVDYTGLTMEESHGHGWNTPFHPDDKQRAWEAWQLATQHNATYSLECRLRRADGAYRWWLIRGVPLRSAGGEILKWFGTCTDIEDFKQAEEKQRKQTEELRARHEELTRFNRVTSGRELRMIELKQQVNALAAQLGQPAPYPLGFMDAAAEQLLRATPRPAEESTLSAPNQPAKQIEQSP